VSEFIVVPAVKFEIHLPATYIDPADPTETPKFVQLAEVANYLREITAKYKQYGGYTISNPFAPPPLSGGYQGGPQERSFWAMIIVPDHLLNDATQDIQQMVRFFQEKYHQAEILCYSYHVNWYKPSSS